MHVLVRRDSGQVTLGILVETLGSQVNHSLVMKVLGLALRLLLHRLFVNDRFDPIRILIFVRVFISLVEFLIPLRDELLLTIILSRANICLHAYYVMRPYALRVIVTINCKVAL